MSISYVLNYSFEIKPSFSITFFLIFNFLGTPYTAFTIFLAIYIYIFVTFWRNLYPLCVIA